MGSAVLQIQVQIPALPFPPCVILAGSLGCATSDKVSDLSVPPFPRLQKESNHILTWEGSRETESA